MAIYQEYGMDFMRSQGSIFLMAIYDDDPMTTMEPGIWFQSLAIFWMAPKHEPRMALPVSH